MASVEGPAQTVVEEVLKDPDTRVITADNVCVEYEAMVRPLTKPVDEDAEAFYRRMKEECVPQLEALLLSMGISVATDYETLLKIAHNDDQNTIRVFNAMFDCLFQSDPSFARSYTVQHALPLFAVIREFYARNNAGKSADAMLRPPNSLFDLQYVCDPDNKEAESKLQPTHEVLADALGELASTPNTFFAYIASAMERVRSDILRRFDVPIVDLLQRGMTGTSTLLHIVGATLHALCNPEQYSPVLILSIACDIIEECADMGLTAWYSRVCQGDLCMFVQTISDFCNKRMETVVRFSGLANALDGMLQYLLANNAKDCVQDCLEDLMKSNEARKDDEAVVGRMILQRVAAFTQSLNANPDLNVSQRIQCDPYTVAAAHQLFVQEVFMKASGMEKQQETSVEHIQRLVELNIKSALFIQAAVGVRKCTQSVVSRMQKTGIEFWLRCFGGPGGFIADVAQLCNVSQVCNMPTKYDDCRALLLKSTQCESLDNAASGLLKRLTPLIDNLQKVLGTMDGGMSGCSDKTRLRLRKLRQIAPIEEDPIYELFCAVYVLYEAYLTDMQHMSCYVEEWNAECKRVHEEIVAQVDSNSSRGRVIQARMLESTMRPHSVNMLLPHGSGSNARSVALLYAFLGLYAKQINLHLTSRPFANELFCVGAFISQAYLKRFCADAEQSDVDKLLKSVKVYHETFEKQSYASVYKRLLQMRWIAPLLMESSECARLLMTHKKDMLTFKFFGSYMAIAIRRMREMLGQVARSELAEYTPAPAVNVEEESAKEPATDDVPDATAQEVPSADVQAESQ